MTGLSELARQKAKQLGADGERWLAELPELVEGLCRDWGLTVLAPLAGGSSSYVARVRTAAETPAVLKIALPTPEFAGQLDTVRAAHGRGYAVLLADDPARHAMLLEALGPSLHDLGLPPERTIQALTGTLQEAWQVPHNAAPAGEKAAQLARLITELWEKLDRPCGEPVIAQVLRYAANRAADTDRRVVVHGDPHPGNALRVTDPRPGAESGFVFVDPESFPADPAYDCGVVLRDWCTQLLAAEHPAEMARRYCRLLAEHTDIPEHPIWEWGFLERVSSGLYLLDLGDEPQGRRFLAAATLLL